MKSRRNLHIMYAIALLHGMVFYAPIASLYRQAAGLDIAQIAIIEGISYLFALAMELPFGLLADRIGYRRTMIAGCGLYFISKLIFWQAEGFAAFLLERLVLSAALAGFSGVDESIIYLSCPEGGSQRAFARYDACSTAGLLLAAGMYAVFIRGSYRAAALATMICYALAALLSLGLCEVRTVRPRDAVSISAFGHMLLQTVRSQRLMILLLGLALFREAVQLSTVWLNQNQYLRCGMDASAMGAAYMAVRVAALPGALSQRLTNAIGEKRFAGLCFSSAALGCGVLIFARSAGLSIACIAVISASGALMYPLGAAICNRQVQTAGRATMLSIFAIVQGFGAAGMEAICGRLAKLSLDAALGMCALACLVALACFRYFCRSADTQNNPGSH